MSKAAERLLRGSPSQSKVFFALGDTTRLSLIAGLRRRPLSATSLAHDLPISRQATLKHLNVLERAGLVRHQRCGKEVLYRLDPRPLHEAQLFLDAISSGWDRALRRLRGMVEADPASTPRRPRQASPQ